MPPDPAPASSSKTAATRERFVSEAMALFGTQGFERTSMAQIAAAAGGSRANLYLYFHSKAEIVMARMRMVEVELLELFKGLDDLESHDQEHLLMWLNNARSLWLRYADEFSAISSIMDSEDEVLDEWLGLVDRVCQDRGLEDPTLDAARERAHQAHLATLLNSLERNFYFMYIRGRRTDEAEVLRSLASQWANLYNKP